MCMADFGTPSFFQSSEEAETARESIHRNRMDRKYSVHLNSEKVIVPPFCTCCMKPATATEIISFTAQKPKNGVVPTVSINLPVCPECLAHRQKARRANWILLVISSVIALASVLGFAALFPSGGIFFWLLPIVVAAAAYILLGLLFRLPKLGGEHSAMQHSAWISGFQMQDHDVLYTFTNWRYANLFANANTPPQQTPGSEHMTTPVIEEYHPNRTKHRTYFRAGEHAAGIGALTLMCTAALLLVFGGRLAALSPSALIVPTAASASSAVSSVPSSSATTSSKPSSAVTSSKPASSAASSKASSKTSSSRSSAASSKASSVRSSAASSSKASSAVSSQMNEDEQRQQVIDDTLAQLKAELVAMEKKLRDYEARLDDLWAKYIDSGNTYYRDEYRKLYDEYDKYYKQYDWKVNYYNNLVEQYNNLNSEG